MTRLSAMHGGINLAQGFPNYPAPPQVKDAAKRAIDADINQYAITWGSKSLRDGLARTYRELYAMQVDPETMLTVTCGSTEAMLSTLLAICDPGDEVIVLEPFYENYGPDAAISGATPIFVPLRPPSFEFDADELARAFTSRTKAIIVNSPNNPTGRVFTRTELETIARLCREHDVIAVTDEIYEHILYEGEHIPIATLAGMAERTVTISAATISCVCWMRPASARTRRRVRITSSATFARSASMTTSHLRTGSYVRSVWRVCLDRPSSRVASSGATSSASRSARPRISLTRRALVF